MGRQRAECGMLRYGASAGCASGSATAEAMANILWFSADGTHLHTERVQYIVAAGDGSGLGGRRPNNNSLRVLTRFFLMYFNSARVLSV